MCEPAASKARKRARARVCVSGVEINWERRGLCKIAQTTKEKKKHKHKVLVLACSGFFFRFKTCAARGVEKSRGGSLTQAGLALPTPSRRRPGFLMGWFVGAPRVANRARPLSNT